jgi:hypothetical protein
VIKKEEMKEEYTIAYKKIMADTEFQGTNIKKRESIMTKILYGFLNAIKAFMSKAIHLIKRFFIFLIKIFYIGSFFLIGILLLKMVYFPQMDFFPQSNAKSPDMVTEYTGNEEMIERSVKDSRSHFHITDEHVLRLESDPPLCLTCHGIYPHSKDKKTESLINLHTGFMACEVCHIRKNLKDKNHFFAWVDLETGITSMRVKGGYGKYTAKIIPIKSIDGHPERLDKLVSEQFSQVDLKLKDQQYAPEQSPAVVKLKRIHEYNLSKKPVSCLECHKKDGYLDFTKLGFPQNRIDQLISSEVSRMVEHYETFYMPKMLIPK